MSFLKMKQLLRTITDESNALNVSYFAHAFRHNGPPSMEDTNRPGWFGPAFFVCFQDGSGSIIHAAEFGKKYGFLYTTQGTLGLIGSAFLLPHLRVKEGFWCLHGQKTIEKTTLFI
jgi:hypothetical protein